MKKVITSFADLMPDTWDQVVDVPISPSVVYRVRMIKPGSATEKIIADGVEEFRKKLKKKLLSEMETGVHVCRMEEMATSALEGLANLTHEEIVYRLDEFDRSYVIPYPLMDKIKESPEQSLEMATRMTYALLLLAVEQQQAADTIPEFLLGEHPEKMTEEEKDAARQKILDEEMSKRKNILLPLSTKDLIKRIREFSANYEASLKAEDFSILLHLWSACRDEKDRDKRTFVIENVVTLRDAIELGDLLADKMLEVVQDNPDVLAAFVAAYAKANMDNEVNFESTKEPFRGDRVLEGDEKVEDMDVSGGLASSSGENPSIN